MNKIKTLLTKSYGVLRSEINDDLQKSNPLSIRGIYLIEVDNGVVWGYDTGKYKVDELRGHIIRKNRHLTIDENKETTEL